MVGKTINDKYIKQVFETDSDFCEWFGYYNYSVSCFLRKEFLSVQRYDDDRIGFLVRLRAFGLRLLFLKGVALKKRIAALLVCVNQKAIAHS